MNRNRKRAAISERSANERLVNASTTSLDMEFAIFPSNGRSWSSARDRLLVRVTSEIENVVSGCLKIFEQTNTGYRVDFFDAQ